VALLDHGRDVVGLVLDSLFVARPARCKAIFTDSLSVKMKLIDAVRRCVNSGLPDRGFYVKGRAEHWGRTGLLGIVRKVRLDPLRVPIQRLQETHLPERRFAPARRILAGCPDADSPVVSRAAQQLAAAVEGMNRLRGIHFERVPNQLAVSAK